MSVKGVGNYDQGPGKRIPEQQSYAKGRAARVAEDESYAEDRAQRVAEDKSYDEGRTARIAEDESYAKARTTDIATQLRGSGVGNTSVLSLTGSSRRFLPGLEREGVSKMGRDHLLVRDIMSENVRTVLPGEPAIRAAQVMVQSGIRNLVVNGNNEEVVGVLSERQILKHFSPWISRLKGQIQAEAPAPQMDVQSVMVRMPITVMADTPISQAARILATEKIGCLPVVDDRSRVVGVLTPVDVMWFVAHTHAPEAQEEFQVFTPPASVNESGEIVLPAEYVPEAEAEGEIWAILALVKDSERIGVKLFARGDETGQPCGARPVTVSDGCMKIPAKDFFDHYKLNDGNSYEVTENESAGYFVLSPVSSGTSRSADARFGRASGEAEDRSFSAFTEEPVYG